MKKDYQYPVGSPSPIPASLTRPDGTATEYSYDLLDRLTGVYNRDSSQALINSHVYSYKDGQGADIDLRTTETTVNGRPILAFIDSAAKLSYNGVNQVTGSANYAFDADGNMTKGLTPDGYVFTATYDAENRLVSVTYNDGSSHTTTFVYAANGLLGEQVVDGVTTRFIRDGYNVVQERNSSNAVTRSYVWDGVSPGGIGGLLELTQGGAHYNYLYDGKGNVRALIDESQNVVASYAYDPFGKLMAENATLMQPYRFSTKRYYDALGLNYFGYRFLNAGIGHWMSRDPLGEAGGLNLYGFVGNSPMNAVDPNGLSPVGFLLKLTRRGRKLIVREIETLKEAIRLAKKGNNLEMDSEKLAEQVAEQAADGKNVLKHKGHDLRNGCKGGPHYQVEGQKGHIFYKAGVGALILIGEFLDPFDAIAGELADDSIYYDSNGNMVDADGNPI